MVLLLVLESTVVSSCEEGERIPLSSQASKTNVPTASHGCASGEENKAIKLSYVQDKAPCCEAEG